MATAKKKPTRSSDDTEWSDTLLPSQYWLGGCAQIAQPEKRLMAAVLEEAISVLLRPPYSAEAIKAERETKIWFDSDECINPFSFVTICDVLGLEPDSVREAIGELRAGNQPYVRPRISAGRGRHRISQSRRRRAA
jgi:hypothetical protein